MTDPSVINLGHTVKYTRNPQSLLIEVYLLIVLQGEKVMTILTQSTQLCTTKKIPLRRETVLLRTEVWSLHTGTCRPGSVTRLSDVWRRSHEALVFILDGISADSRVDSKVRKEKWSFTIVFINRSVLD